MNFVNIFRWWSKDLLWTWCSHSCVIFILPRNLSIRLTENFMSNIKYEFIVFAMMCYSLCPTALCTLALCLNTKKNRSVLLPPAIQTLTNAAVCVSTCLPLMLWRFHLDRSCVREPSFLLRTHLVKTRPPLPSQATVGTVHTDYSDFTFFLLFAAPRLVISRACRQSDPKMQAFRDECACMCALVWLTRWECLALFPQPALSLACVCCVCVV